MTAQQVHLQPGEIGPVDPRFGKVAEAGVDAVDRGVAVGLRHDDGPRRGNALTRRRRQSHHSAIVGDGDQIGEFEMGTVKQDHAVNKRDTEALNTETPLPRDALAERRIQ